MKKLKKIFTMGIMTSLLLLGGVKTSAATHMVKSGDNLYRLSLKYNTSVNAIKRANNLNSSLIVVGQKLSIPSNSNGVKETTSNKTVKNSKYSDSDMTLMAKLVRAEAGGESYKGKVAVAAVVLNRVNHKSFPNTVRGVIYQRNQFSPVRSGSINRAPDSSSIKAVREAINGVDPTGDALYFYNPRIAKGSWLQKRPVVARIGNHNFAR